MNYTLAIRLLGLFFFAAFGAAAQTAKPYDLTASAEDNATISLLINAMRNPEMAKPDYYGLPNYYAIVRKNGKYGVFDEVRQLFVAQPIYDSITVTANCLKDKKWTNFLYQDIVVNFNPKFPDGIIFKKGNKYGLKQLDGTLVLKDYDEMFSIGSSAFRFKKGKHYGFAIIGEKLTVVN